MLKKSLAVGIVFLFVFSTVTPMVVGFDKDQFSVIEITFKSCNYSLYGKIYYPIDNLVQYPGIIFCEGRAAFVDPYSWIPKALAQKGYVVLIFDFPGQGLSEGIFRIPYKSIRFKLGINFRYTSLWELKYHYLAGHLNKTTSDAITFLTDKSPVKHMVNENYIGLIGHSLGGYVVTETATFDNRVDTVIALSHSNPRIIDKISVPIQLQCGMFDIKTKSIPTMLRCYKEANSPKELIIIEHGTHIGFTTAFGRLTPCPPWQKDICLHYTVGWFDYFLKNDKDAYESIIAGANHLSKVVKSRYNFGEGDIYLN